MRHFALILMLAASAAAQNGGTVEGKVTNAATGAPVASAIVVLNGDENYVVRTDGEGRFKVEDVAPGRYEARPQRDGYTAVPPGIAASPRIYPRITVAAGQQIQGMSLRLIQLGAISGRVVDPDGDPLSGAFVEALRYSYPNGRKQLVQVSTARSNDRGEYRLFNLPPGRYYLRASKMRVEGLSSANLNMRTPRIPLQYLGTYFPSAGNVSDAVLLELPPGGELSENTIRSRVAGAHTVTATIAGNPGEANDFTVSFSPAPGEGGGGLSMSFGMMGAPPGRSLRFANNPPGLYLLRGESRKLGLHAQQLIRIEDSDVEITLKLAPEMELPGVVRVEGGGRIALDKVRINMESDLTREQVAGGAKADGTFTIQHVQPLPYRISTEVPAGGYLKSVRMGEQPLTTALIDNARDSGPLAIVIGTDGGALEGTVTTAEGAPAEGATVVLVPEGGLSGWRELTRSANADRHGRFEVHDIAPGAYRVFAWEDAEPGAPLDPDFRKPFERDAVAIQVPANGRNTLSLKAISLASQLQYGR